MTARVRLTAAAEADVEAAADWYAAKRPALAVAFLEAVNEVVRRIGRNPLAFPQQLDDVRAKLNKAAIHQPRPVEQEF